MAQVIWHKAIFTGIINSSNLGADDIYLTNKSNEQALKILQND